MGGRCSRPGTRCPACCRADSTWTRSLRTTSTSTNSCPRSNLWSPVSRVKLSCTGAERTHSLHQYARHSKSRQLDKLATCSNLLRQLAGCKEERYEECYQHQGHRDFVEEQHDPSPFFSRSLCRQPGGLGSFVASLEASRRKRGPVALRH